jgi:hypothetical protein
VASLKELTAVPIDDGYRDSDILASFGVSLFLPYSHRKFQPITNVALSNKIRKRLIKSE